MMPIPFARVSGVVESATIACAVPMFALPKPDVILARKSIGRLPARPKSA